MSKRVLIVDDSPSSCAVLADWLHDAGYDPIIVSNVAQLIERLDADETHLVFLDMVMPETPGWTVGERIRGRCRDQGIPIVFISGMNPELLKDLAKLHGADGWLSKPFTKEAFATTLEAVRPRHGPDMRER